MIGHGGHTANFWLRYRRQVSGGSVVQSAYHGYEAAHIALEDYDLKSHLEVVIANTNRAFRLANNVSAVKGSPVSLSGLEKMFERYGPRDTKDNAAGRAD
jgi:hypothetical protein